ncbi:MAG: hypothetical protein NT059_09510 [Planctomycetota bacterium]|nr:hypothetical protein [Planctomycetota bacterium]
MRTTATILFIALAVWFAVIMGTGAAAMGAFGALPKLGISVAGTEGFFAGDTAEMGRFAAGKMMQPLFMAGDWVQFAASALTVGCTVRLARLGGLNGMRWARAMLFACVAGAALILAWRAWSGPAMTFDLLAYWDAVAANDREAATAARARFDSAHVVADAGFKVQLVCVFGALLCLVPALLAAPVRKAGRGDW